MTSPQGGQNLKKRKYNIMGQTVIGVFDNSEEAHQAVEQLVNQGFANEDIDILCCNSINEDKQGYDCFGERISKFFKALFGDSDEASNYLEVVYRGSVVTVYIDSPQRAEQAAVILDANGAIDVDERANEYRNLSQTEFSAADAFKEASYNAPDAPLLTNQETLKGQLETNNLKRRCRIIECPVQENLRLQAEHANNKRNQVENLDFQKFRNGDEVTDYVEPPVVKKEARRVKEFDENNAVKENSGMQNI